MILSAKWMPCGLKPLYQGEPLEKADVKWHQMTNLRCSILCFLVWCHQLINLRYSMTLCFLLKQKAMMRKVMHHSEEIHLFVLINKLTTHFTSEPPLGTYFCMSSLFAFHVIDGSYQFGEIMYRTRWWGLPKCNPTMMRTEISLRSNTFAADGSSFQFCTFWMPVQFLVTSFVNLVAFLMNYFVFCWYLCLRNRCFVESKAMMRKVMHHSEEIYLLVLINKLTTHFISEPPHGFVFSDLVRHMSYWFLRNQLF